MTSTAAAQSVRLVVDGARATVRLAHGRRQVPATWDELYEVGRRLPGDVRVVVLGADGPDFWLSSSTTDSFLVDTGAADNGLVEIAEAVAWLGRPDLVTIAALQGRATDAGFALALGCDLRVLAHDVRLSMGQTQHGLVPDLDAAGRLADLLGYPRALELCLTGREVGAAEAELLGLAELVVAPADLEPAVDDLVAAILAAPRSAVIETTALLAGARGRTTTERRTAQQAAQQRCLTDLAETGDDRWT